MGNNKSSVKEETNNADSNDRSNNNNHNNNNHVNERDEKDKRRTLPETGIKNKEKKPSKTRMRSSTGGGNSDKHELDPETEFEDFRNELLSRLPHSKSELPPAVEDEKLKKKLKQLEETNKKLEKELHGFEKRNRDLEKNRNELGSQNKEYQKKFEEQTEENRVLSAKYGKLLTYVKLLLQSNQNLGERSRETQEPRDNKTSELLRTLEIKKKGAEIEQSRQNNLLGAMDQLLQKTNGQIEQQLFQIQEAHDKIQKEWKEIQAEKQEIYLTQREMESEKKQLEEYVEELQIQAQNMIRQKHEIEQQQQFLQKEKERLIDQKEKLLSEKETFLEEKDQFLKELLGKEEPQQQRREKPSTPLSTPPRERVPKKESEFPESPKSTPAQPFHNMQNGLSVLLSSLNDTNHSLNNFKTEYGSLTRDIEEMKGALQTFIEMSSAQTFPSESLSSQFPLTIYYRAPLAPSLALSALLFPFAFRFVPDNKFEFPTLFLNDEKQIFGGLAILRYVSRTFQELDSLYPVSSVLKIENNLNLLQQNNFKDLQFETNTRFLHCDSVTLADIFLWEICALYPLSDQKIPPQIVRILKNISNEGGCRSLKEFSLSNANINQYFQRANPKKPKLQTKSLELIEKSAPNFLIPKPKKADLRQVIEEVGKSPRLKHLDQNLQVDKSAPQIEKGITIKRIDQEKKQHLQAIEKGTELSHTTTVDKSAPVIEDDVVIKKLDHKLHLEEIEKGKDLAPQSTVDKSTPKLPPALKLSTREAMVKEVQQSGKKLRHVNDVEKVDTSAPVIEEDIQIKKVSRDFLDHIKKGKELSHTETVDKSAPRIENDLHIKRTSAELLFVEIKNHGSQFNTWDSPTRSKSEMLRKTQSLSSPKTQVPMHMRMDFFGMPTQNHSHQE